MRFLGFVAACTAAALTACSGGGSMGGTPTSQQNLAGAVHATTISAAGRSASDRADCESETGSRHEHSAARAGVDHAVQEDGGDKDHEKSSCSPTTLPALTVTPAALAIDCNVTQFATITVAGTPPGLIATAADPQQAIVGAPAVLNGNTTFVVTGEGTLPTSIALTDTAGATASVTVTLQNCPWRR